MSSLIKALEQSEHQHQQLHQGSGALQQGRTSKANAAWLSPWLLATFVIATPIVVGGYSTYQEYLVRLEVKLANPIAESSEQLIAMPYEIEPIKTIGRLKSTRVVPSEAEPELVMASRDVGQPIVAETDPMEAVQPVEVEEELDSFDLSQLDLSGLPNELAMQVESVLNNSAPSQDSANSSAGISHLEREASKWIGKLPALNFQTHNYTSNEWKRWVKVNNVEFSQGDSITEEIFLVEIAPRYSVIRFRGSLIRIPALYDWQG